MTVSDLFATLWLFISFGYCNHAILFIIYSFFVPILSKYKSNLSPPSVMLCCTNEPVDRLDVLTDAEFWY